MVAAMRDLSLHLMDIVQNSLKAGANNVRIAIEAETGLDRLSITIDDDGHGMTPEMLANVTDPFFTTRTTRSVGLGIPLLKEHCDLTGGELNLESSPGQGTRLKAVFGLTSIDRMPLGEISDTMTALVLSDPEVDYRLVFQADGKKFELDWRDMRAQLADVPLNEPAVLDWIQSCLTEQQQYIFGGVLHEITR